MNKTNLEYAVEDLQQLRKRADDLENFRRDIRLRSTVDLRKRIVFTDKYRRVTLLSPADMSLLYEFLGKELLETQNLIREKEQEFERIM